MMNHGWYARRRGILEHLRDGKISLFDMSIHDLLCLLADHQTGIAMCSSVKIAALAPRDDVERSAQGYVRAIRRSLEHLESIGWIKRWAIKGKKGNYPVAVARFDVMRPVSVPGAVHDPASSLSMMKCRVNIERTTDWRDVQYDAVHDAVHDIRHVVSTVQEVKESKNNSKPTSAPSARNSTARARRLALDQETHIEANVGTGPETPPQRFCALCKRTKAFHSRPLKNILRDDPSWQPHDFQETPI
jgi:hypothetical protein